MDGSAVAAARHAAGIEGRAAPTVCLTIGSSDSCGGAGIQGDIKAFAAIGCYASTAVVGVTAQNTKGVTSRCTIPVPEVRAQLDAVLDDLIVDAVKIGTLWSAELVEALADRLAGLDVPLVLDPVMVTASGSTLVSEGAVEACTELLLPMATVVTPNLAEARMLARDPDQDSPRDLCAELVSRGASAVVITGGGEETMWDWLFDGTEHHELRGRRSSTRATHGAGCAHSALITGMLARKTPLFEAVSRASTLAAAAVDRGLVEVGCGEHPVDVLDLRSQPTAN